MLLYCQTDTEFGTIPTGPGNGYLSYTRPINFLEEQSRNKTDGALPPPVSISLVSSDPPSRHVHGLTLCIPSLSLWNPLSALSAIPVDSLFLLTRRACCGPLDVYARVPGSSSRAGPWGRVWHFRSEGTPRITISFLSRCSGKPSAIAQGLTQ